MTMLWLSAVATIAETFGRRLRVCRAQPNALAQLQPRQIRALDEAQRNSSDRLSVAAFVRRLAH
jgi:hypothetical protein